MLLDGTQPDSVTTTHSFNQHHIDFERITTSTVVDVVVDVFVASSGWVFTPGNAHTVGLPCPRRNQSDYFLNF